MTRKSKEEKTLTPSEKFYEGYAQEFEELISIPMVAFCKMNHTNVPYEYTNRVLRYKRNTSEIDGLLRRRLRKLAMYCFQNKIEKSFLETVVGGNLWDYYKMKTSFGGGN